MYTCAKCGEKTDKYVTVNNWKHQPRGNWCVSCYAKYRYTHGRSYISKASHKGAFPARSLAKRRLHFGGTLALSKKD